MAVNAHRRKLTNGSKGKLKFDATFGTFFRISKYFQRRKDKLYINFSLGRRQAKSVKMNMNRKYWFDFLRPSKKHTSGGPVPSLKTEYGK
jgi:hypothetical protein